MTTPSVGIDQLGFVALEGTYDTALAYAATDAFGFNSFKATPSQEWAKSLEHLGSASLQSEIEGKRGGRWETTTYVKPISAGTQPDVGPILEAAFGLFSAGVYTLVGTGAPKSLQFGWRAENSFFKRINGAWVEQLELESQGNAACILKASGGYASEGTLYGVPITNGSTYSAAATTVTLAAASAWKVLKGAIVAFGADTNSGAGYLVTAVGSTGLALTITPALTVGFGAGVTVVPVTPSQTVGGTIAGGISNGLTIASTEVGYQQFKLSLATGIHGLDKEGNVNRVNRLARGDRSVTGEMMFYFLDENAALLGDAWNGTRRAVVFRCGPDTAGLRMRVNMPAARIAVAEPDLPDKEEASWSGAFVARRDAANEDELTIDVN